MLIHSYEGNIAKIFLLVLSIILKFEFNMFLVSSFGEPCLLDIQCSAVTMGAICAEENKNDTDIVESTTVAENKVCTCSGGDYYRFGNCFKKRCKIE